MRIIDQLRRMFPGKWKYNQHYYNWEHEAGWKIIAYSVWAPQTEMDEDTFYTQFRRSDTYEMVYLDTHKRKNSHD